MKFRVHVEFKDQKNPINISSMIIVVEAKNHLDAVTQVTEYVNSIFSLSIRHINSFEWNY